MKYANRPPLDEIRDEGASGVDAGTVLDNVIELDRMLDDGSRRELDSIPVLELSKHMRIRAAKPDGGDY